MNQPAERPETFGKLVACLVATVVFLTAIPFAAAEVIEKSGAFAGKTIQYKVVLPNDFEPAKTYPGILAFSGGTQTMRTVDRSIERFWRAEAERRQVPTLGQVVEECATTLVRHAGENRQHRVERTVPVLRRHRT